MKKESASLVLFSWLCYGYFEEVRSLYKHLEIVEASGAERRMVEMFVREKKQILAFYPELEEPLMGIERLLGVISPGDLFTPYWMHHRGGPGVRDRFDSSGKASYIINRSTVVAFSNAWLEKPILPFDIALEILNSRHVKIKWGTLANRIDLCAERIDQSLQWFPFFQREKKANAWVATRLMSDLKVPASICPTCGHGKGELRWVKSSHTFLGCIWGIGTECVGDGWILLEVRRSDNGELFVI